MSRQIKDVKDIESGLLVYPRTHIKAVVVDDTTNLEDTISVITTNGDGNSFLANDGTYKEVNVSSDTIGTSTVGSTTQPIYLSSGTPTTASTYAGGTKVTLNGSSKGGSTASFYAPTSAGTLGYVLTSNGSGAPSWIAPFSVTTVTRNGSTSSIALASNAHTIIKSYNNTTINCVASTIATSGVYKECLLTIYNYHSSSATLNITDGGNAVSWINYEDIAANSTYLVSISNGVAIMIKTSIVALEKPTITLTVTSTDYNGNLIVSVTNNLEDNPDGVRISITLYTSSGYQTFIPSQGTFGDYLLQGVTSIYSVYSWTPIESENYKYDVILI